MTAVDSALSQGFQSLLAAAGVDATYLPAGGLGADEITVRGDFLERYERIDAATLLVVGTSPAFECVADDVPNAQQGDRLLIGGTYYHATEARRDHDGAGNTLFILSRDTALPIAPSRLGVELSNGQAVLSWTRNATNNTAVEVWYDVDGDGEFTKLATLAAGTTTYTDTSGAPAIAYRLRNTNKSGPSPFSHIFNTQLWALIDEQGNYITDEQGRAIETPTR